MKFLKIILLFIIPVVVSPQALYGQNFSVSGEAALETLASQSTRQPFYFWANKLGQVSVMEQYNLFTHVSSKCKTKHA